MAKRSAPRDPRGYRKQGLQFSDFEFSSKAEKRYVKAKIETLASQVAEARAARGFSQERLAELANVSVSTIKFIEQNQRAPSLALLMKLIFVIDRESAFWQYSDELKKLVRSVR